jgi:hypothetical protein
MSDDDLDRRAFEIELDLGDLMEELWATHPEIADRLQPIMEKVQDLQKEAREEEEDDHDNQTE